MRIVYLDIDSLSPSHMSCYGYPRKTTPAIDAIAAKGVRFTNVYCSDAPCMPSRSALYSGRLGIQTGAVGHSGTTGEPRAEGRRRSWQGMLEEQGLARQFQRLGMHTAMISPFGQRHGAHWIYAGFNEIHNPGKMGWESAEEVQPYADDWLQRNASKDNWYLHLNYWDPHTEYRVPADYGNPFADQPMDHWITPELLAEHAKRAGPHSPLDLGMYDSAWNLIACNLGYAPNTPEGHAAARRRYPRVPDAIVDAATLQQWFDAYDTAIRYVDDHVGRLVASLKRAGVYDQTAIVISADHGENQGELGIYGEHATADQGTCNIPLIVKWPGGNRGKVDHGLHYHLDLAPTYMHLTDGRPQPVWDGQSFAGAIRPGAGPADGRDQLVVSQCTHVCQRSVRFGPWLYIRTFDDGFYPFGPEMLFNIAADPHEVHDLADRHPEVCGEGARRLASWHDQQMRKLADAGVNPPTDPLVTVLAEGGPGIARHTPGNSPLPDYVARLRQTGRAEAADALCKRYPAACAAPR